MSGSRWAWLRNATTRRPVSASIAAILAFPQSLEAPAISLTPAIAAVELAASGLSNRDIAQTLFVTEKTVEAHLGRAYPKVSVRSRRELADVLAGG